MTLECRAVIEHRAMALCLLKVLQLSRKAKIRESTGGKPAPFEGPRPNKIFCQKLLRQYGGADSSQFTGQNSLDICFFENSGAVLGVNLTFFLLPAVPAALSLPARMLVVAIDSVIG